MSWLAAASGKRSVDQIFLVLLSNMFNTQESVWQVLRQAIEGELVRKKLSETRLSEASLANFTHNIVVGVQNFFKEVAVVTTTVDSNETASALGKLCITPQRMCLHMRAGCISIPAHVAI